MIKKLFSQPILVVILASLVLASVAAAPPPQTEDRTYTIQKDDWLSKLADKEYGNPLAFAAIYYYNNLKAAEDDSVTLIENPDVIEVGWTIYLPSSEEAAAYMNDSVSGGTTDSQGDGVSNSNDAMSNSNDAIGNSNDDDMSNSNDDSGSNSNDATSNSNDDAMSNSNDDSGSNSNDDSGSNSNDDSGSNSNDHDSD